MDKTLNVLRVAVVALSVLMVLPLSAQVRICQHDGLSNLADTTEIESRRVEPGISYCKYYVNSAYFIWRTIDCAKGVGVLDEKEERLRAMGIRRPHDPNDAYEVSHVKAVEMSYAGESLENTQQAVLEVCREMEVRDNNGENISWQ